MARIRKRLSYANVMATLAVFFVLGGGAYALSAKSVGTKQLKNGAVTNKKIKKKTIKNSRVKKENLQGNRIKDGTLTEKEIADGTLTESKIADGTLTESKVADGTLTGKKIADGSIGDAKLSDYEVFGDSWVRVTATEGADADAAKAAAPKIELASKGQISIYGKCYRNDPPNPDTFADVHVETSAAGAIFRSSFDSKNGGDSATDFLNPSTNETDRTLGATLVLNVPGANQVEFDYRVMAPDGTALQGNGDIAVKQGELAEGNGVFGSGNVCLFSGFAAG